MRGNQESRFTGVPMCRAPSRFISGADGCHGDATRPLYQPHANLRMVSQKLFVPSAFRMHARTPSVMCSRNFSLRRPLISEYFRKKKKENITLFRILMDLNLKDMTYIVSFTRSMKYCKMYIRVRE